MHTFRCIALAMGLAAWLPLAGCEGGTDEAEAPKPEVATGSAHLGIQGGEVDQQDDAVVGLVVLRDRGAGICTGTLVAPNAVLTAQHCVTASQGRGRGVSCDFSSFGDPLPPEDILATTEWSFNPLQVLDTGTPGRELRRPEGDGGFCGRDLALIELAEPIPPSEAEPLWPRVDEAVAGRASSEEPTETYSAVGYGVTGSRSRDSGTRRRRDGLDVLCGPGNCGLQQVDEREWVGDEGVCQGDSGGPSLDAQGRVIGVASRGSSGCNGSIYTSIGAWSDWLKETTAEVAEAGGHEPPRWSRGWPTDRAFRAPVGATCDRDTACPSGYCEEGRCSRRCNADAPCPDGWSCHEGVDGEAPGRCRLDPVGASCDRDVDCDAGRCRSGYCTRPCGDRAPCPDGYACDPEAGVCSLPDVAASCDTDADCDGSACIEGRCSRGCDADRPCPGGWRCDEQIGLCRLLHVGAACTGDAGCSTERCLQGTCTRPCGTEAPCPAGYRCASAASGLCRPIRVGGECSADGDCSSGICRDGTCTRSCTADSPCPAGFTCAFDDGLCEPAGGGCGAARAPAAPSTALVAAVAMLLLLARRGLRRASGGRRRGERVSRGPGRPAPRGCSVRRPPARSA